MIKKYNVFISSTCDDLIEERKKNIDILTEITNIFLSNGYTATACFLDTVKFEKSVPYFKEYEKPECIVDILSNKYMKKIVKLFE